jgi:hypothetical protein
VRLSKLASPYRDVLFHPHSGKLDAIRITVRLSSVGYRNQTRAMRLFRRIADESDLTTGVYADFFNVFLQAGSDRLTKAADA